MPMSSTNVSIPHRSAAAADALLAAGMNGMGSPGGARDAARLMEAPALSVRELHASRGGRALFDSLDLALAPGEIVWLRGHNGRGKTSLLRLIAGLARPEGGELLLDGCAPALLAQRTRRLVYVAHANALKDDLSVAEALEFLLCIHGRAADRASVAAALDYWGMAAQARSLVRRLSQGQRRRVALARLAAERDASLWLLDEPFDALDTDGVQRLVALLERHLQRGGSVLLTGHQAAPESSLRIRELDLDARAS